MSISETPEDGNDTTKPEKSYKPFLGQEISIDEPIEEIEQTE